MWPGPAGWLGRLLSSSSVWIHACEKKIMDSGRGLICGALKSTYKNFIPKDLSECKIL